MTFEKWHITWCSNHHELNLGIRWAFSLPEVIPGSTPEQFSFVIGPFWFRKWN